MGKSCDHLEHIKEVYFSDQDQIIALAEISQIFRNKQLHDQYFSDDDSLNLLNLRFIDVFTLVLVGLKSYQTPSLFTFSIKQMSPEFGTIFLF